VRVLVRVPVLDGVRDFVGVCVGVPDRDAVLVPDRLDVLVAVRV
jgi:hypothetical protein